MIEEPTIYKFGGSSGMLQVLQHLTLKVTPPMEFNDPFECTPRMDQKFSMKLLSEENVQAATALIGPPPVDIDELRAAILENPDVIHALQPTFAEMCRKEVRRFCERVTSGFGVVCFSFGRDNILMWSHYADRHHGLVVGFDANHKSFSTVSKVEYRNRRVLFDLRHPPHEEDDGSFARELIWTKHEFWGYEKEARAMMRLQDLGPPTLNDGKPLYLMRIAPEAIRSVTLGMRCSRETEFQVHSALKANGIDAVVERVVPDDHEFKILFQSVHA